MMRAIKPTKSECLASSAQSGDGMTEVQSKVLVFEKVPTKGFKLEILDDRIRRAKIPGGWLVTIRDEGITFVPDPKHEWDGSAMA
jgi:hypothetical protein